MNAQLLKTVNKRAFEQIKAIKKANNMLEAEEAIRIAVGNIFRTFNLGLLKIRMRKEGQESEFEKIKQFRLQNEKLSKKEVQKHLSQYIPVRLHKAIMYKNFQDQISK